MNLSRLWMIATMVLLIGCIAIGYWGNQESGLKDKMNTQLRQFENQSRQLKKQRDELQVDLTAAKKSTNLLHQSLVETVAAVLDEPIHNDAVQEIMAQAEAFETEPATADEIAIMHTSLGYMKLKLFVDKAPNHCNNFKRLANSGYYDGTTFHRVIPGFMIQGGDILSRDGIRQNDGTGGPGWNIDAEFNDTEHVTGILSMARSSSPNSAGSQFFICADRAVHLDGKYTAFGKVTENLDVIQTIVNVPRDERDNPLDPVKIYSVRVFTPVK